MMTECSFLGELLPLMYKSTWVYQILDQSFFGPTRCCTQVSYQELDLSSSWDFPKKMILKEKDNRNKDTGLEPSWWL